jgi:hypothetical protein
VVRLGSDHWLVLDRLDSDGGSRDFRLHWLLADGPYLVDEQGMHLHFRYPEGDYHVAVGAREEDGVADAVRAVEGDSRGWAFPYYQIRVPAVSLTFRIRGRRAFLWTLLGPSSGEVRLEEGAVRVKTQEWSGRVLLAGDDASETWIAGVARDRRKDAKT